MSNILLFLNISGGEILLILVVVYLVFGPKKIPELARMLGKGINEMRRATSEIKNEINREISGVKKDIDLDIDMGDPLGIKKTVENTINPKKGSATTAAENKDTENKSPIGEQGIPETKAHKSTSATKRKKTAAQNKPKASGNTDKKNPSS